MEEHATWADELEEARAKSSPSGAMIAQLATIRAAETAYAGRPACRTVNIRKIVRKRLLFCSDTRSGKVADVKSDHGSSAELCIYFPLVELQFRLSGTLHVITEGTEVCSIWESLSDSERIWWAWPTPAQPRSPESVFDVEAPTDPPPQFCVCSLEPDFVDVVYLTDAPFRRVFHYRKEATDGSNALTWTTEDVNP